MVEDSLLYTNVIKMKALLTTNLVWVVSLLFSDTLFVTV